MAGFVQDPMRMPTLGSNDQLARTTINHGSVLSGAPNAAQRRPPHPMLAKMYPQLMPATPEGAQKKKQISFPGGPGLLNKQGEGPAVYPADLSINFLDSKTLARLNPLKRALIGGVIGTGLGYGVGALGSPFLFNSEQDEEKKKEQRSGVRTISAMLGGLLGTAGSLAHFNYKHPSLINSVQPSAAPFSARTSVSLETPGKHFGRWYDKIPGGFKRVVEKAKEVSNTNRAAGSDVSGFAKRWPEMPYKNLNDPTRVNWHAMPKDVSIFERQTSGQTKGRGFPVDLFSYPSSPTSRATLEHELTHNVFPGATDSSRRDGWLKDYVDTFRDYLLSPSEIDVRLAEIKRRFAFATGELVDTPEKAKKAIEWWKARNNQYRVDAFLDKGTNAASIGSDWEDVYERLPERFKQELYKRMPELVQNEGKRMGKTVQASATSYGPNGVIYKPGEGPVTSKVPISSPIKGSPQLPQPMSPQGNQAPGSVATRGMAPPMPTSMPMGKVACVPGLWTLCKQSQNPLAKGENIVLTETESTGDAPSMQSITFYPFEPSKYASVLRSAASGEVRPKWKPAPDARNSAVNLSDVARKTKVDSVLPPAGSSGFLFKKAEGLSPLSEQDIPQGNPAMQAPRMLEGAPVMNPGFKYPGQPPQMDPNMPAWMKGPASTLMDYQEREGRPITEAGMEQALEMARPQHQQAYDQLTPENQYAADNMLRKQWLRDELQSGVKGDMGAPDWAQGKLGPQTPEELLKFQQKYPLGLDHQRKVERQRVEAMTAPNLMDQGLANVGRLTDGVTSGLGAAGVAAASAVPAGIGWLSQQANRLIGSPAIETMSTVPQDLFSSAVDTARGGAADVINSYRPSQLGGESQANRAIEDARARGLGAQRDLNSPTGYTRPTRMPSRADMAFDTLSRGGEWLAKNGPQFAMSMAAGTGLSGIDSLLGALGNPLKDLPVYDYNGPEFSADPVYSDWGYTEHGDIRRAAGVKQYPTMAINGKSPASRISPPEVAQPSAAVAQTPGPISDSGASRARSDLAMPPSPQALGNPAAQAPVMPVSAQMPQAPQQPVGPPEWASRFQPQIERAQRAGNTGEVRRLERMQAQAPQLVGSSRPDYMKWNDPQFVNDWKARQGGGPVSPSQAPRAPQPQEVLAQMPQGNPASQAPMAGVQKPGPSQDVAGPPGAMSYPNGKPYQYGYGSDGRIMEPVAAYMQDTQMRSKAGLPEQDARTAMTPEYSQAWNKAMAQPNPAMSAPQGSSAGPASGDPRGKMMQQTSGTFSPPGAGQYQRAMPNMNQMAMPNIRQQTHGTFSPPAQAQAKVPTPTGNLRPASVGAPKSPFQTKMSLDKAALPLRGLFSAAKGGLKAFGRGAAKAAPTVIDDAVRGGAGMVDDVAKTVPKIKIDPTDIAAANPYVGKLGVPHGGVPHTPSVPAGSPLKPGATMPAPPAPPAGKIKITPDDIALNSPSGRAINPVHGPTGRGPVNPGSVAPPPPAPPVSKADAKFDELFPGRANPATRAPQHYPGADLNPPTGRRPIPRGELVPGRTSPQYAQYLERAKSNPVRQPPVSKADAKFDELFPGRPDPRQVGRVGVPTNPATSAPIPKPRTRVPADAVPDGAGPSNWYDGPVEMVNSAARSPMAGAQGAFSAGAGRAGDMLGRGAGMVGRGAKATAKALAPYGPTAAGGAVGLGLINHGVGQYRGMLNESMGQGRELMNEGLTAGRQFMDDARAETQKRLGGAPDIQTAISQGMQNGMPNLAIGQSPVGQGFVQMLQGGGFWPFLSSLFSTGKQNLQKDYSTIADKIKQPQSPALSAPVPEDQSAELAPWLAQLLNQREDDSNANFWAQNNQQPAVGSTLSNASDRLG